MVGLKLLVTMVAQRGCIVRAWTHQTAGIDSYGTALWWTAMLLTTMGSDTGRRQRRAPAGWVLALYSFAVFGYVTALLRRSSSGATPTTMVPRWLGGVRQ